MNIQNIAPFAAMAVGAVLALFNSAFKQVPRDKNDDPMYTFEYTPPASDPYSAAHVQDTANWVFTSTPDPCLGSDKACTLEVPADFVNNPGSSPTLKSSIAIQTQVNEDGFASVSSTAADGEGAVIANQAE